MRTKPRLLFAGLTAAAISFSPIGFAGLSSPLAISAAQAATATVKIDIFFDQLAPYGVWVKNAKYHYVFCPKVDADWEPYTRGHWVYLKDWGWYFASAEPFAWALYHYGRWFRNDRIGWCWVPGNAWAGAWVAWRRSNDVIGWAALEPEQEGFQVNVKVSKQEPPHHHWVFVEARKFLEPQINVNIVIGDRQPEFFDKTKYAGTVVVQNNMVVNNVIEVNFIQQITNQTVVIVNPKPVDQPQQSADATGDTVAIFAPQISDPTQDETPTQAIDEDQAAQQQGQGNTSSSSAASSGEVSASASASVSASASEGTSASTSSESSAPASTSTSSSEAAPTSSASSEGTSSVGASSAPEAGASTSEASSAEPSASSQAATSSSSEAVTSSSEATSAAPTSSEVCPEGYIIDPQTGLCVLDTSSSAAQ